MIKIAIVIMIMITITIVTTRPILGEGESVREVGGLTQCSTCSHPITNQPLDNVVMIFIIGIMTELLSLNYQLLIVKTMMTMMKVQLCRREVSEAAT